MMKLIHHLSGDDCITMLYIFGEEPWVAELFASCPEFMEIES